MMKTRTPDTVKLSNYDRTQYMLRMLGQTDFRIQTEPATRTRVSHDSQHQPFLAKALLRRQRARERPLLEELQPEHGGDGDDGEVRDALGGTEEAVGPGREARPGAHLGGERPADDARHHQVADALSRAERAAGARGQAASRRLEGVEGPRHGSARREPGRPGGQLHGAVAAAAALGHARDWLPAGHAAPEHGGAAAAGALERCGRGSGRRGCWHDGPEG